MREIKFRAWDKKRKEILRITMMDFAEWWVSCRPPGTQVDPLEYGERNSFKNEETDRHILMEFTGLKDKNGVEIYEGDVVTDTEYLGEVVFHDRWYEVGMHSGKLAWCLFNKKTGEYIPLGDCRDEETWEIVGNIYENPELVEEIE